MQVMGHLGMQIPKANIFGMDVSQMSVNIYSLLE